MQANINSENGPYRLREPLIDCARPFKDDLRKGALAGAAVGFVANRAINRGKGSLPIDVVSGAILGLAAVFIFADSNTNSNPESASIFPRCLP